MTHTIYPEQAAPDRRTMLIFFWIWIAVAAAGIIFIPPFLGASFPLFTILWLAVPALVVWRSREPARAGFRRIPWGEFLKVSATNLGLLLLLMALFEPWSRIYSILLAGAVSGDNPDSTFAWLVRYPGLRGLSGMFFYSSLVTLFGEELFFRGWLQQSLLKRMPAVPAILLQAALFTLPQLVAAFLFPPLQAILWVVVYSWLAIGVVGGWAAARTGSIWPSLVSAAINNLVLVILLL